MYRYHFDVFLRFERHNLNKVQILFMIYKVLKKPRKTSRYEIIFNNSYKMWIKGGTWNLNSKFTRWNPPPLYSRYFPSVSDKHESQVAKEANAPIEAKATKDASTIQVIYSASKRQLQ